MTIPTEVIMRMATLGLNEAQAMAVADMLTAVEAATEAGIEVGKEKARARWRRYMDRLDVSAAEWRRRSAFILARDGLVCAYCGDVDGPFAVDHMVPLMKGGTSDLDNLCVACAACNSSKQDKLLNEWGGRL